MTDNYPEYLNPFAEDVKPKSKLSISNSFKEFKRTLRRSFRIKTKQDEEVTVRQKTGTVYRRPPLSYPNQQMALPRSRFRERLTKSDQSTSTPGPNPFEEEEEDKDTKRVTMRRKGKKRAPLPPKSLSSQDVNDDHLEIPNRGSHWSLTSGDTDYSGSTDHIVDPVETENNREAILEKFKDFNKEMEKLKDDSNNNVITKEDSENIEASSNVPDLVISCPSDTDSAKLTTTITTTTITHEDERVKDLEESNKNEDTVNGEHHSDNNEKLVVTDITNNMIEENNKINNIKEDDEVPKNEDERFLYHEKKSLYINGSRDEINECETYTGRVSLYITGSTDDLDACNNNEVCDKNGIDENSNDEAIPTPKQRKHKLSKNTLLGM